MLTVIAICIGACLGALSRWQLGLWLNPGAASSGLLPWGTLAANLIGGYLVGVCMGVFQQLPDLDPLWRLAWVTGFLGALTTFSIANDVSKYFAILPAIFVATYAAAGASTVTLTGWHSSVHLVA